MIRGKNLFKYVNEIKENYYSIYKACKILLLFQIVVINTQKKSPFFSDKTSSCNSKIQDNLLSFYAQVTYV